ncbi:MAG: nuclear transport factor 2 family protein [Burkholderiaceae bacterium]
MTTRTPEQAVQHQLDAYNDHDLPRFLEVYEDDVVVYRLPSKVPAFSNVAQLAQFYRTERFHLPALRAELVNRMVIGNVVIDHERVHGVRDRPFEVAASYQVVDGRIRTVWFFSGD